MSQLLDLALRMDEWMDGRTEPNPQDTSTSAEVQQFIITIIIAMGSRFSGLLFRNIQIIFRALIKFSEIPKVYVIKVYNKKEYVIKKFKFQRRLSRVLPAGLLQKVSVISFSADSVNNLTDDIGPSIESVEDCRITMKKAFNINFTLKCLLEIFPTKPLFLAVSCVQTKWW